MQIIIDDNPEPVCTYYFEKEGRKTPGIIFCAEVPDESKLTKSDKHSDVKFMDMDEILLLKEYQVVKGLHRDIQNALKIRKNLPPTPTLP